MRNLPWNRVTRGTKIAAMVIFIVFPFVGFFLGIQYQKAVTNSRIIIKPQQSADVGLQMKPAEWETLHDDGFGVALQYPKGWELDKRVSFLTIQPNTPPAMTNEERTSLNQIWPSFTVESHGNKSNISLRDAFYNVIFPTLRTDVDHNVSEIRLNGLPAISWLERAIAETQNYLVVTNDKIIKIRFDAENAVEKLGDVSVLFDKMLASLRFTGVGESSLGAAFSEISSSVNPPIAWKDGVGDFTLASVSLGNISAPPNLSNFSDGGDYPAGTRLYLLTLNLTIYMREEGQIFINMKRILNEKGDTIPPNTKQFIFPDTNGNRGTANVTYTDQKVIFVVQENEKEFLINTGVESNIFFTVKVENGKVKVEKIPTGEG